jgi:hypothetical protein
LLIARSRQVYSSGGSRLRFAFAVLRKATCESVALDVVSHGLKQATEIVNVLTSDEPVHASHFNRV